METIYTIFYLFLYQPIINFLILIYQHIPGQDFGVAIILLTIIIRFFLYPLSAKSIKSQKAITELQPQIKEIQEKYKNDQEKQVKEVLNAYKQAKVSPFSGFVPILIQLPILIALYKVLWDFQNTDLGSVLYSFISVTGEISPLFLGSIDLAKTGIIQTNGESVFLLGSMLIIIGAGISQFFQMKMMMRQIEKTKKKNKNKNKKGDPTMEMAEKMQKKMIYFFPFFTVFILMKLPLAIGLYWLITSLFSIGQQHFILKKTQ